MNLKEITNQNIYYVGVNDRVTSKFEALWPIPNGVSYNSYIVSGSEKTALIDTVEISEIEDFIHNIVKNIGSKSIDYVVINHMEPDHSGGIPEILNRFPNAKLIGNRQTLAMVRGFYHIEDSRMQEIKDNETVSLGDLTLRFILTPMVHWPETMMTWVEEANMIFSGDAFGTFGALNGAVIDTEMDTEKYIPEMYRYYSNIVAKYGKFVLKALEKVSSLNIEYICPTHGPVWHERINDVVDIYRKLASWEGEDGVTIVYGSMYGNTANLAEELASQLAARGVRNIRMHNASYAELSYMISDAVRYKGIVVCAPTYSMHLYPPVEQFMIALQTREIKNKVLALAGSFTWASASTKTLNEYARQMNIEPAATIEMKQSMSQETLDAISTMADNIVAAL